MSAIPQHKTQNHSTQTLTDSPHLKAVNTALRHECKVMYRHVQYVIMHVLECIRNTETQTA